MRTFKYFLVWIGVLSWFVGSLTISEPTLAQFTKTSGGESETIIGGGFLKKENKVKVINGPDMPASVNVENEPNVAVTNTVDTNTMITNDESTPVPVVIQDGHNPEFFEFSEVITMGVGNPSTFLSRNIPTGKIAIIKYISAVNIDVNEPNDQVFRLAIISNPNSLWGVLVVTTPGGGFLGDGETVLLPTQSTFGVSLRRSNATTESNYRVTVSGRLVDVP